MGEKVIILLGKIKDIFLDYHTKTTFDLYKDDVSLLDKKTSVRESLKSQGIENRDTDRDWLRYLN